MLRVSPRAGQAAHRAAVCTHPAGAGSRWGSLEGQEDPVKALAHLEPVAGVTLHPRSVLQLREDLCPHDLLDFTHERD